MVGFRRNNPFSWLLLFVKLISYGGFEFGYNPYSYTKESRRIIRFAKRQFKYKNPENFSFLNYYDRVRSYFQIPLKGDFVQGENFQQENRGLKISICPESKELRRSLNQKQLSKVVEKIEDRYKGCCITLCASPEFLEGCVLEYPSFKIERSKSGSVKFLSQLLKSDLLVAVDTGPLHIANAFKIPTIGIFSSALPETVINANSVAEAWRSPTLAGVYCEKLDCIDAVCLDEVHKSGNYVASPKEIRLVVSDVCQHRNFYK